MNPRSLTQRTRRLLWLGASLVLTFTLFGFFVLPGIVKSQLERRLGAELGRTVSVGQVRINPYALSISLEDFAIREADGNGTFVGWRRLFVDFEALASLRGSWVLGAVELDGWQAAVQVKADGSFNFSDILAKLVPATSAPAPAISPPAPGRPLRVDRLAVAQARLAFTDQSRSQPFATELGPLTFAVTGFHTGGDNPAPYQFEATTEAGEKLRWAGNLQAAPLRSTGEFRLERFLLAKYAPYYRDLLQADLDGGTLSVSGRYEANLSPGARVLRLVDGALQVRDLKVVARASRELALELPSLDVTGINADAVTPKAAVGAVTVTGGRLRVRREKDGAINLVSLLQPPPVGSAAPPATPAGPAPTLAPLPSVSLGAFTVQDFAVDLADLAAPRPVQLALSGLQFSLHEISLAEGAVMPLQLAVNWAPRGSVRATGTVVIKPALQATLQTEIADLALLPLSPYLEQFLNARITQGTLSLTQTIQLAKAGDPPVLTLAGSLRLDTFGLVDGVRNEELAGLTSLTLSGLKVATAAPLTVAIAEVKVAGPYARLIVNADHTLNLAALGQRPAATNPPPAGGPPAAAPASAATPAATPRLEIGQVVISAGDFSFDDRSITPHVRTSLGRFGGTVAGLSSANPAKAEVSLQGTVDGAGPVAITGRLDPLGPTKFVDLRVEFKHVDLVPFSPYAAKFAGYELARGKLVVATTFLLDGSKIDATNVVTLERFTFGTPVPGPDATKLPVRLGVALLKDLDGRIVIDLPVQGQLGDPEFKVGRVIGRVLVNLLTKAAVSPFKLLGSMFGGGGDELAFQTFAPGRSTLQPAEIPKLATMIKALTNRPALGVALEGGFDAAVDTPALKREKLAATLRRARWEEKRAADPTLPPPEQLVITPAEEAAMVKMLYDRKFPPGTEFGAPLPPPPPPVPPPPPPTGFFQRLVNTVTGKARREQAAAQAESARLATEHQQALAQVAANGLPFEAMLGRLEQAMEVDAGDLNALATARAQRVRDYFITPGQINADRLFLARTTGATPAGTGPRVVLSLQ